MEVRIKEFKRAERACGREIRRKLRVDIKISKEKEDQRDLVEQNVQTFKQQYGDEWLDKMKKMEDIKRRRFEEDLYVEKQQNAIVNLRQLTNSPNLLNQKSFYNSELENRPAK